MASGRHRRFRRRAGVSRALTSVIRADLERSGLFKLIDTSGVAMTKNTAGYGDWRNRGADALAAGGLGAGGDGRLEATPPLRHQQAATARGRRLPTSSATLRTAGRALPTSFAKTHRRTEHLSTRIAYVIKSGPSARLRLTIADADGQTPRSPCAGASRSSRRSSSRWHAHCVRLFENKKPIIFVHTLATGQRR